MADNAVERRLRELIGHLLASQEEERRRLACALHDDFSQQLALLAIDLEQLRLQPPSSPTELTSRLQELSERTNGISSRVYRLSHELRPAKLEALGLFATLQGYCDEVSEQYSVGVTFDAHGRPAPFRRRWLSASTASRRKPWTTSYSTAVRASHECSSSPTIDSCA